MRTYLRKLNSKGFTLIELLVVIAIIAILIALLVPAVQKVREAASRTTSTNNLKQLGLAAHSFHDVYKYMPFNGTGAASANNPQTGSWGYQILPYIEQQAIFTNGTMTATPLAVFLCPGRARKGINTSTTLGPGSQTDYCLNPYINVITTNAPAAGGASPAGVLAEVNKKRTLVSISDGTSNVIFAGHGGFATGDYTLATTAHPFGTIMVGGGSSTARGGSIFQRDTTGSITTHADVWGSSFPQGALFALCDATVRLFPYSISGGLTNFLDSDDNQPVQLPN